jgi:hypothetical protein
LNVEAVEVFVEIGMDEIVFVIDVTFEVNAEVLSVDDIFEVAAKVLSVDVAFDVAIVVNVVNDVLKVEPVEEFGEIAIEVFVDADVEVLTEDAVLDVVAIDVAFTVEAVERLDCKKVDADIALDDAKVLSNVT